MISKKKYSIRKVSVGTASVLIGIAAGSLGTAYAQEEINNVVVSAEVNRNVSEKPVDKPILEESMKPSSSPKVTSKPTRADAPILTPAPARPSSPIPTPAPEIKPIPSADVPDENIARTPDKEDKIDWTLIKEKEYLSYSLENIIDGKEKERLVNSLRAAKSTDDLVKIRNEYEVIKKAEEKQKELGNRVYSLKRVHNLYLSDDQNEKFTKEVALAKNDNELNEIINKYKLEESKRDLSRDYNYSSIPREEIKAANSIVELNNLKEKYKLLNLKKELQNLVNRTSSTHRDENTGKELPLLSKDRMEVLLKEIEALKTPEKAEELRKIIDDEQQIIYRREELISRIKYRLTDLTDEQLVSFVNELEKYTTEADLNKVKEKIEGEDKKLREERIKKEQANILEVLNTKAKLNDYEKEKLKQEMVELYREEYKERERGEEKPTLNSMSLRLKYTNVGKSNSEVQILRTIERIEYIRNNEYLSDETKRKYINQILQKNEHRHIEELIDIEVLLGKIDKSNLSIDDKNSLTNVVKTVLNLKEKKEFFDRGEAVSNLYSIFNNIENINEVSEIPSDIKKIMKNYLLRDGTTKFVDFEMREYKNYCSLKNKIFSLTSVPKELTSELKRLLEIVEKEEIEPITNSLISEKSNKEDAGKASAAIPGERKLSQLTTKVESLEKLYSYIHIPEYKLIKFRDEILDATSSGNVRNTLATARAVEETLEILGYNGNYPKVEDRLKDKKVTPKEEKVTEAKKENREPVKAEDKKDNKESVKEPDNKEVPKGQTVPENKQEVSSKETPKVTSDKTDSSNDKKQETSENNTPVENYILATTLSGHDVAVSFDKNKIKADDIFVGAINDEKLNKAIIEKLGSEYKILEVFEIHFKKDGKKLDSGSERTVRVSVVKNDNAELEVYHISDNNVLEKVKSKYSDGSLQFKIDHFSKFTILERSRTNTKNLESRVQIVPLVKEEYNVEEVTLNNYPGIDDRNNVKLKELSKTGLSTTKELGVALLALGVAITIRKRSKFH
ncbi:YSIRK-type signal peptide-containing protein [Gemella sp.]